MSSVMMACYPEVFEAGAIMAGLPYRSATNSSEAFNAMQGNVDKNPAQWATLVEDAYPSYSGDHPRAAIFHGSSDGTVDPMNARELLEQWTEVQGVDRTVDRSYQAFAGANSVTREDHFDGSGGLAVSRYSIQGMGHGIVVDPGSPVCQGKGGVSGSYAFDFNLFSSYWAARFFDIVPYAEVRGPNVVGDGQQGILYHTPFVQGSTWSWEVPNSSTIVSGQGSDTIEVDWGSQAGYVKVTRTDSDGCTGISDSMPVGITALEKKGALPEGLDLIGPNPSDRGFEILLRSKVRGSVRLSLYDERGRALPFPEGRLSPGESLRFGQSLSPGIYYLKAGKGEIRLMVP